MYLLDTNVVSDAHKRHSKPTQWLQAIDPRSAYISVITIGEIERGIVKARRSDAMNSAGLVHWLDTLRANASDRILDVTEPIAIAWGRISSGRTRGDADALIAATALVHGLTVVTRNVADFEDTGVAILNPWTL